MANLFKRVLLITQVTGFLSIQQNAPETNTWAYSGTGYLSVQQNTPVTNAWAYYNWCSPVGNPVTNLSTGNALFGVNSIYEDKNAVEGKGTNARMSDVVTTKEGYTSPNLTISRRWLYTHFVPGGEAEADYVRINTANVVPAGAGFTMKGVSKGGLPAVQTSHDQLYEFRGRPNSGNLEVPVANGLKTLSGNPYPSALDLNRVFYDTDNGEIGAFWFYDEDRT